MESKQSVAVVFHTGMGDALQVVPLIRTLRAAGRSVTGLFTTPFLSDEVIGPLQVLDRHISVTPDLPGWLRLIFRHFRRFDRFYLDYTSSAPHWLLLSCLLARKVYCNRRKWYFRIFPNLHYRPTLADAHIFDQHLHLGGLAATRLPESAADYSISYPEEYTDASLLSPWMGKGASYAVVQVCAANNSVGYKNWPVEKWVEFLRLASRSHPGLRYLVVGDRNETAYGAAIEAAAIPRVRSLVGHTDYRTLATLVTHATHYIGLDSGTMHLAAMLGKPTFVLWGATDAVTLGYGVFDPVRHMDLSAGLPCQPCHSWIRPNRTRVDHPLACPDYRCIREMGVIPVWEAYSRFLGWNGLAAEAVAAPFAGR